MQSSNSWQPEVVRRFFDSFFRQFLWCELLVDLGPFYPTQPPGLSLGSSRGFADAARDRFLSELRGYAVNMAGEAQLFMLLDSAREGLTALNAADGECSICLASLTEVEANEVLRLPCYHVFHRSCIIEYCRSEVSRHGSATTAAAISLSCPECRRDIPWTSYPELHDELAHMADQQHKAEVAAVPAAVRSGERSPGARPSGRVQIKEPQSRPVTVEASAREEAFIRLHHLHQGNDEKEKPLLRLLKESGLDAVVFYGKPSLLHIQGDSKDVDAFARTAKQRHITVTINVAQRSQGPPIASGVTPVASKKGALDGVALKEHLEKRGLGETSFTIIG